MGTQDTTILKSTGIATLGDTAHFWETGDITMRGWIARIMKGWPTSFPLTGIGARPGSPALWTLHQDVAPVINSVTGVTTPAQWVIWDGSAWQDVTNAVVSKAILSQAFTAGATVPSGAIPTLTAAQVAAFPSTYTNVASAATTDIGAVPTKGANITGVVTITSFGTAASLYRLVKFAAVLTLTHNVTTLILPGAANITTAAGDIAEFTSDPSGNWTCIGYTRASGQALVSPTLGALAAQSNLTAAQVAALPMSFTSIASAATTDLSTVATSGANVTGVVTITSFGTGANLRRTVKFAGILTLTYNATSLILPTAANITTAAGDTAEFQSDVSGNWTCIDYSRASGAALVGASGALASQNNLTAAQLAAVAFGPFTTIASATTTDLSTVATTTVSITGVVTITSFGTGANLYRHGTFASALTLTHNATSLILPGAANIVTAAGDRWFAQSDGSGNWTVLAYIRAIAVPDTLGPSSTLASAATTDLGSVGTDVVLVTGTVTITSLGTAPNRFKIVTFSGILTLTYNATSLILPNAANITTASNDTLIFASDATGNWTCKGHIRAAVPATVPSNYAPDVIVEDQRTAGTNNGDALTNTTFVTRTLNTLVRNVSSIASLATNQVTLPAGTYYASFSQCVGLPGGASPNLKSKLRNITDSTDAIIGIGNNCQNPAGSAQNISLIGSGMFTIASSKAFALQTWRDVTGPTGGLAVNAGVTELYCRLEIWKIA